MILETILGPLIGKLGSTLIDKIFPDPEAANKAKLELLKMQQTGELAQLTAETSLAISQLAVNTEEAKSNSLFKSGWRPAVGWVCVCGLIYSTLGANFINVVLVNLHLLPLAPIDTSTLMTLLFGLLGLGYYRTKEKIANK